MTDGAGDLTDRERAAKERPETLPVNALDTFVRDNREVALTAALALLKATSPETDRAEGLTARFDALLRDEETETRNRAAMVLGTVASDRADYVVAVEDALVECLAHDAERVRRHAAGALAAHPSLDPSMAATIVDRLPALQEEDTDNAREATIDLLTAACETDPDAVATRPPELLALVRSGHRGESHDTDTHPELRSAALKASGHREQVRTKAAVLLAHLAESTPAQFESHGDALVAALANEENLQVRKALVQAVGYVALDAPGAVDDALPAIEEFLETGETVSAGSIAAWSLAAFLDDSPDAVADAVADHAGRIRALLAVDDANVRQAAVGLLSGVTDHRPDSLVSFEEALFDRLDDDRVAVREGAALALAATEDESVQTRLRETVANDDPAVRSAAGIESDV